MGLSWTFLLQKITLLFQLVDFVTVIQILRLKSRSFLVQLTVFFFVVCLLEFKLLVLFLQLVDFLLQGGHCGLDWFGFKVRILYYRNRGWDIVLLTNTVKWSGCHPVLGLSCFFVFELRWQMTSLNHVFKLLVSQIFWIDLGRNNWRFDLS
jgi:hypothetical protein